LYVFFFPFLFSFFSGYVFLRCCCVLVEMPHHMMYIFGGNFDAQRQKASQHMLQKESWGIENGRKSFSSF
jgi:hypothetical protein